MNDGMNKFSYSAIFKFFPYSFQATVRLILERTGPNRHA